MNRERGLCPNTSWKLFIFSLKVCRSIHYTGPCTLPFQGTKYALSRHILSKLPSIASAPSSPLHACNSLAWPLSLECQSPANMTLHFFPVYFLRPANVPLLVVMWELSSFILSPDKPMGPGSHSSTSILLPIYSDISDHPITQLPTCFHTGILFG